MHEFLYTAKQAKSKTTRSIQDNGRFIIYSVDKEVWDGSIVTHRFAVSYEDEELLKYNWSVLAKHESVYLRIRRKQFTQQDTNFMFHRVVLERKLGKEIPNNLLVDHKKKVTAEGYWNSLRNNLRIATIEQNNRNRENSTGLPPHIYLLRSGRYRATINKAFDSIGEAEAWAKAHSLREFGEFSPYYDHEQGD